MKVLKQFWMWHAGKLVNTLQQHKGPIFCLRWSRKGDLLLSGSVDKTAIVWDGRSGKMIQQFQFHRGAISGLVDLFVLWPQWSRIVARHEQSFFSSFKHLVS